ncbi:hypothetical protein FHR92_003491 [Fontibacillus solani]|uniref:Uncharacterized protein n=1 Tax=Fontibacillus solani TaxID=1572857 RepID=A0A7W3SVH9_9BACL|nr:hypothetical protein [Fontibacillus solani]
MRYCRFLIRIRSIVFLIQWNNNGNKEVGWNGTGVTQNTIS